MDDLDLTNLPRFLDHLEPRSAEAARLARGLLDDGWAVKTFWGPQQMDVWQLDLLRGGVLVQFRIERGIADGIRVARDSDAPPRLDDYYPIGLAVFVWARIHDKPYRLDHPDDIAHDLEEYGPPALRWLEEYEGTAVDRVYDAWITFHRATYAQRTADPEQLRADGLRAMEAAARSATGESQGD